MESQLLWFAGLGGLALGLLLGLAMGRRGSRDATRVRELEEQIATAASAHAQYRSEVAQHFGETSRRLHDLTLQYRSVYEHLADGARTLCPEGTLAIAPSLAEEAALPATASPTADDAQLDLALDAPDRWTEPEREDDLGPLLDEETPAPPLERAS